LKFEGIREMAKTGRHAGKTKQASNNNCKRSKNAAAVQQTAQKHFARNTKR